MATMASMLARAAGSASSACRAARAAALASARAARSAAAARRAAVAASRSRAARSSTDAAASADLALGTSSSEARSLRRCDAAPSRLPLGSESMNSDSSLFPDRHTPVAKFVADEKDLESDEALWALYERCCKHFNQERDRDEMARRFSEFKSSVLLVHRENNADRPYKLAINQFTDGKLSEVMCLDGNPEADFVAKLPKTGSWFVWLNGKYYMEVPEECQPECVSRNESHH